MGEDKHPQPGLQCSKSVAESFPPVIIRRLGPADAADVATLERSCFPTPWTEEQLRKGLASGSLKVFGLLLQDGQLGGYLSFYGIQGVSEIVNFAILPALRNQGYGRRLLTAVLQSWKDEGIHTGFLEVRASNAAALHLYSAAGFSQTGRRKGYYPPEPGAGGYSQPHGETKVLEKPGSVHGAAGEDAITMCWQSPPPTTGA